MYYVVYPNADEAKLFAMYVHKAIVRGKLRRAKHEGARVRYARALADLRDPEKSYLGVFQFRGRVRRVLFSRVQGRVAKLAHRYGLKVLTPREAWGKQLHPPPNEWTPVFKERMGEIDVYEDVLKVERIRQVL